MVILKKLSFLIVFFICMYPCFANEEFGGYIRLVLDERSGSFSLYYLSNPRGRVYEPLLYAGNSATSFISIMIDETVYKPSQSRNFSTRIDSAQNHPSLIFESSFATISQVFSPVKTPNSNIINGVQISTTIQNNRNRTSYIGFRMLLDTALGEERGRLPFLTNNQAIQSETIIDGKSNELFWMTRGNNATLMGSIANPLNPNARRPDYLIFANWRRLYDSNWDLKLSEGRSFNNMPYSVGDSAVCYYFLPVPVNAGESITLSIILSTEDVGWYSRLTQPQTQQAPLSSLPEEQVTEVISVPVIVPEAEPVFLTEPDFMPEPVFEPEPVYVSEPLFEPEYIFEPEPVFEQEPVYVSEPVYEPELAFVPELSLEQELFFTPEPGLFAQEEIDYPYLNTAELRELYALQDTLNSFIAGEINLLEEDLLEIENTINRLKNRRWQ